MSVCVRLSLAALLLPTVLVAEDKPRSSDAAALEAAMVKAIEKAEPSIACILVSRDERGPFPPEDPTFIPDSYCSGVVIDEKGLILTNEHVIRDGKRFFVRLPGDKSGTASVIAADQRSDLSVLKFDLPVEGLRPIEIGHGDKLKKGQLVLSLANPFAAGFRDGSPSASWGIISNLRRRMPPESRLEPERSDRPLSQYATLIQTDARLNLGCSGGALIDLDGKLVGLTNSLAALSGTETPGGFGLPMDAGFRRIIDRLKQGAEVEYGFIGVNFGSNRAMQAIPRVSQGVFIPEMIDGGPAANAGLQPRSIILSINGFPIRDNSDLSYHVSTALAGSTIKVEWRPASGGGPAFTNIKLAKLYVSPDRFIATKKPREVGGLTVDYTSTLPPGLWQRVSIARGVLIRKVETNSAADKAGLHEGKIITHVNRTPVTTPTDFYLAVDNAGPSVELTLLNRADKIRLELR
jgi:S1-C subfamily serine protease